MSENQGKRFSNKTTQNASHAQGAHAGAAGKRFASSGQGSHVAQPGRTAATHRAASAGAQPSHSSAARHTASSARPAGHRVAAGSHTAHTSQVTQVTNRAHAASGSAQATRVAGGAGAHTASRAAGAANKAQGVRGITPAAGTHGSHHGGSSVAKTPARSSYAQQEKKRRRRVLPLVLIVIGVGLIIAAAGIFITAQLGYKEATDTYNNIASTYVTDTSGDGIPNPDFDALSSVNADVVGWVYVPGTIINYPVVQTTNNEKYLNTMFDGKTNSSGTIFMDCDGTAPGVVDQQTTLYGHHMNNGGMFNPIADTTDQATFDNIKTVYYITRDAIYEFEPLLTKVVDGSYTNARTPNFTGDESLASYLKAMLEGADAKASDASDRISSAEQVLTLVTCKRDILANGRAAMICTLKNKSDRATGTTVTDGTSADANADAATAEASTEAAATETAAS